MGSWKPHPQLLLSPQSKFHNNLRLSLKGLLLAGYFHNVLVLKWNGKENAKRVKLRWWVWKTQTEKTKLWNSQSLPVTKLFYDLKTNLVEELCCNIHHDCKGNKSSVLVATFYHCCASFKQTSLKNKFFYMYIGFWPRPYMFPVPPCVLIRGPGSGEEPYRCWNMHVDCWMRRSSVIPWGR